MVAGTRAPRGLVRYAWLLLAFNLAVILWGAYVRASGSGAGCGSHWPLCNGVILQRSPTSATLIEYSHRLTSGFALIGVVALLIWTWRQMPAGHPSRLGAALCLFFMLTEAALGAGLVLFQLVADNATMARAMFTAAHLLNTFVLLKALTLTAWWLEGHPWPSLRVRPAAVALLCVTGVGILLTGASGAIAALGDTLYPSGSLAEGLRADLSSTSHLLIRLRIWHPAIAVTTAVMALVAGARLPRAAYRESQRYGQLLVVAVGLQVMMGLANVVLLAPVAVQMAHLLVADVVWVLFVILSAQVLAWEGARR